MRRTTAMDDKNKGNTVQKYRLPPVDLKNGVVEMSHGGGGLTMAALIESLFLAALDHPLLHELSDQAQFPSPEPSAQWVMATDSHVISPLFFPGGDIGCLAVHGTVNDVAMAGATPLYLSAGFILEEGFPLADLQRIVQSMAAAAKVAGVAIITGDTKVVEKGHGDGVYITTTGFGVSLDGRKRSVRDSQTGDKILISGTVGDHGIAVMSRRENLTFDTEICSDTQSLAGLVAAMVDAVPDIRCLRDPTRGGLAAVLNEWAHQARIGMVIEEAQVPIHPQVRAACEFLGLDPLNVANEGKLVAVCPAEHAERLLVTMRAHPQGKDAAILGEVTEAPAGVVQMQTQFGGRRRVDWISGEQLPRIC